MFETMVWHATLIKINNYGVLLRGKSGSGKSDLALRLIENKQAILVADDAVILAYTNDQVIGKAAENIAGLLEVRGIGLMKYPYCGEAPVNLLINLQTDIKDIERIPEIRKEKILGLEIPQIDLYAMESSAPDKIVAALRLLYGWNCR